MSDTRTTSDSGEEPVVLLPLKTELLLDALDDFEGLPDDEVLTRFGEGCLGFFALRRLRSLMEKNPAVALMGIDFRRDCAPVRALSTAWLGWKGPYLAAIGKLPPEVSRESWKQHEGRCFAARWRTWIAEALFAGGRAPTAMRFTVAALQLGVIVLLVAPYYREAPEPARPMSSKSAAPSTELDPRLLADTLDPEETEIALRAALERVEQALAGRPRSRPLLELKARLLNRYLALPADLSSNSARRAEYQRQLIAVWEVLSELPAEK